MPRSVIWYALKLFIGSSISWDNIAGPYLEDEDHYSLIMSQLDLRCQSSLMAIGTLFDKILHKTFGKIESVNKAFLFWYWQRSKKIFFRNKTFLFFKIESWNFQVQFKIEFRETMQNFNSIRQPIKKHENNNCLNKLNELKFCEVSRI